MRVQEHLKLSTVAAAVAFPWLKQDIWLPFAASILIDVDHYLWYAVTRRDLSLRAAVRYFGGAHPSSTSWARCLHHPLALGCLLFLVVRWRSRFLWLVLAGLLFHVSLDFIHVDRMERLKQNLTAQAQGVCPACGECADAFELHTLRFSRNIFDRYNIVHFKVLCPQCHELAHA
ncbi:MAG TPA: hypothetical protein VFU49_00400 [Ktedonobacteraceae bacterium]|nr:hypothetical protein [Ktedonobacteraceae bacterium]